MISGMVRKGSFRMLLRYLRKKSEDEEGDAS